MVEASLGRMRIVLLGDSHLARIRRDLTRIGPVVINAAVGGSCAADLVSQARSSGITTRDVVVVSVGTNDAAPWKAVRLETFERQIEQFLTQVTDADLVYVSPPGVDELRLTRSPDRTNDVIAGYAARASALFERAGARVLDAGQLLRPLGTTAFTEDGVHLTGAAYDVLLPAIAEATRTKTERPAT